MGQGIAAIIALLGSISAQAPFEDVPHGVARILWEESLGAHRAVVRVDQAADAVLVRIPWRRPDRDPEKRHIIVTEAATGQAIANVVRLEIDRESGTIIFQPRSAPSEYFVYYLPYTPQPGWGNYNRDYVPPKETADPAWHGRLPADPSTLPQASVVRIEARTEFDRFDPMEVVATADEVKQLLDAHPDPYLLFPEDRRFPIRMTETLPLRWIRAAPSLAFRGEALRNEYYAFQIGVFAARQAIEDVTIEFGGECAGWLTCFNTAGIDARGRPFAKAVRVPQGRVQALWFGADVPRDADPGEHRSTILIRPRNAPAAAIEMTLRVLAEESEDRGDAETWRHSRLRWLNSTIGTDDEAIPPYPALEAEGRTVRCLGRSVRFGDGALPESIRCGEIEMLAAPIRFVVETEGGSAPLAGGAPELRKNANGVVVWESVGAAGPFALRSKAAMEFDGHIDFSLRVEAREVTAVRDIRIEIPLRRDAATYLMGIGRPAAPRPAEYTWKWQGPYDSLWAGDVHAGLHCEFRGGPYHGPMLNLYPPSPPPSWHNGGRGAVTIADAPDDRAIARATSGERTLAAGEALTFEFALLPTPVKPLDMAGHFRERYYHSPDPDAAALAAGIRIINVHHATHINPFINYPFLTADAMRAYVRPWQARGMKVKFYYTVRELTNHVTDLWALRSLGHEILAGGPGGGFPWLREHLVSDYTPQWYNVCEDGVTIDAALLTTGESRWYNYYVEGLGWLVEKIPIDGLYLDDVTYDRTILKRMRRVCERARPGCRIDLHSNTAFSIGPANQYAEFFPYVDRLWFGESFRYDAMTPAQWLVEASGIPFGLTSDMLQDGGNRWRGMLYGMTARAPWADPKPIWKLWDEFGIAESKMIGYWEKNCPIRTDCADVLATAFVKRGRTLAAIASWAEAETSIHLEIDWKALGIDPAKAVLRAPAVQDFQPARTWKPAETIEVEPRRGWLLYIEEAETLHVDANAGNDANPGTEGRPLRTIARAAEAVREGTVRAPTTIKVMPGIYCLIQPVDIDPRSTYSREERLTIEASVLPDDPDWSPSRMPVILSVEDPRRPERLDAHTEAYGLRIRTSHVTIRGFKFLGNPLVNNWYCAIERIEKGLEDLVVTQCLFLGDEDALNIYCPVIATGDRVLIDHCIFFHCHASAVFWDGPEGVAGRGCAMQYSIVDGGLISGVWTCATAENFEFHHNIIARCEYVWMRSPGQPKTYRLRDCLLAGNRHRSGYGAASGPTGQTGPEITFDEENVIEREDVVLERRRDARDYLHVVRGTPGDDLGAGLFRRAGASEATPPLHSLDPPVLLPDGKEFRTWEGRPAYARTYHADGSSPAASDDNPGTKEKPFRTIGRAARILAPGERVIVAAGVYRERIRPARGGADPNEMISYEAAPGAEVILKGSRIFAPAWKASDPPASGVWEAPLDPTLFDGYNPFDTPNVTDAQFEIMSWAAPLRGSPPCTLPRGLVFQDGRILRQVAARAELAGREGAYWVDRPRQVLHVRPFGGIEPARATWEIATQETIFAPDEPGLGYIRVAGFTVEHAAGPFPMEQVGAISTGRGHHWIIEDNHVRWANGAGIDLGIQNPRLPQPPLVGHHIVRRNIVTDCGICGICGIGPGGGREFGLLVEDNVIARNAWHDVERVFETAGIKTHLNTRCLIRRNLVLDTLHGPGIWMDWDNRFSRCTRNVVIATRTMHGGIFVEASFEPNLVDQNIVWDTRGRGIYEHDSTGQVFAHNLVGRSEGSGMHLHGKITDRRIDGRPIVGGRHSVWNNIFVENGKPNVFRGEPCDLAGNIETGVAAALDRERLELTLSSSGSAPRGRPVAGIVRDVLDRPREGSAAAPGPFHELPSGPERVSIWPLDPRAPGPQRTPKVP